MAMRLVMMCGEFLKAGEPQKALEAYHHARNILDGLAASQKHNVDLGLTLSLLHRRIGDLMRAQGDLEGAKEAYQSSLAIAERLASFHPGNEELQRNRSEALAALSTLSGAFGFGSKLDCAIKRLEGFPSLQEALASATNSRVEAPAPDVEASATGRRVAASSFELPHEVRDRIASTDATGQLIHSIPRRMRVGALETVEVRIPRRQGADAITVRLRAPEGGFLIFPLSPEMCWTDETTGDRDDYASWRWSVMPQRRGKARLLVIISAQTLDANGVAAEAALPDQVIKVYVRVNSTVRKVVGWGLLMAAGSALGAWGRELYPVALDALGRVSGLLDKWVQ